MEAKLPSKTYLSGCATLSSSFAVRIRSTVAEKFPTAAKVPFDDWRFFVCVLTFRMFMDVIRSSNFSEKDKFEMIKENHLKLEKELPHCSRALVDLENYIVGPEPVEITPQALGFWLAANLYGKDGKTLSKEEYEVGVVVTHIAMANAAEFLEK